MDASGMVITATCSDGPALVRNSGGRKSDETAQMIIRLQKLCLPVVGGLASSGNVPCVARVKTLMMLHEA